VVKVSYDFYGKRIAVADSNGQISVYGMDQGANAFCAFQAYLLLLGGIVNG
jgi:hypothetical protein